MAETDIGLEVRHGFRATEQIALVVLTADGAEKRALFIGFYTFGNNRQAEGIG